MVSGNDELMEQVARDFTKADISEKEKLMLHYAKKLTLRPYAVKERDVQVLKQAGFSDRDIFDINQITAYFNYVNRIADGLGVSLEE